MAESTSEFLWFLLFGSIFLFGGLSVVLSIGRVATLNCHRVKPTQVACELRSSSLLAGATSISQLQGAEVEATSDSEGFRVVLITREERIPLTPSFTSGALKKQENVDRINAFVNTSAEPSLTIQEDLRRFALLGVVASLMASSLIWSGLFTLLRKLPKSCLFDKNSGQVTLTRQNMLFQSDIREERLDVIKVAQIDSNEDTHSIELVLQSGDSIIIGSEIKDREVASGIAKAINQFLNLSESVDSTGNNWKAYYYMYMRLPKKS